MNEANGWKWATLVLVALLLVILSCCAGAWLGGLIGFRLGSKVSGPRHYDMPMPEYYPPYPEMPFMPEIPEIPEAPQSPEFTERPWLGLAFRMTEEGALVVLVVPDSPAEDARLQPGDIIVEVEGRQVTEARPLDEHVLRYAPGDRIVLTVLRNGREREVEVRIAARPADPSQEPMWEGEG